MAEKQMRPAVVERAISGLSSKRERGVGKVLFGVFTFLPGWRVWSTVRGKKHLAITSKAGLRNRHVRVACVIVSQTPSMGHPVLESPNHGRSRSRTANFFHRINCRVHLSLSGSVVLLHAAHVSSVWRTGAGEKVSMWRRQGVEHQLIQKEGSLCGVWAQLMSVGILLSARR